MMSHSKMATAAQLLASIQQPPMQPPQGEQRCRESGTVSCIRQLVRTPCSVSAEGLSTQVRTQSKGYLLSC